jgi:hypothetical protein
LAGERERRLKRERRFSTTEQTEIAEKKTNFVSAYSATSVVKNLRYL